MDIEHIVIHKGADYHCAFPEIIRLQNGELVTVFREAAFHPPRPEMKEVPIGHYHVDDESRIAMVRSGDDGLTWDPSSRVVIDASDGSHDLNMGMISQVSSGEMIMNNHRWFVNLSDEQVAAQSSTRQVLASPEPRPFDGVAFDSQYFFRSSDMGRTWGEPQAVGISSLAYRSHTGKTGIVELPDGTWLLPLCGQSVDDQQDRVFVVRSYDRGETWVHPSTVAHDPDGKISFGEPPLLRLPSGRLLTLMRTTDGYLYQAFSEDDGWTWQGIKRTPIWGHPCQLVSLWSGRVLCTYGYRREPFGIRAALSEDQGETWDMDHEIAIRDDGLYGDLGYPASIQLQDGRILSVYYFHGADGVRFIGGSIYPEEVAYG